MRRKRHLYYAQRNTLYKQEQPTAQMCAQQPRGCIRSNSSSALKQCIQHSYGEHIGKKVAVLYHMQVESVTKKAIPFINSINYQPSRSTEKNCCSTNHICVTELKKVRLRLLFSKLQIPFYSRVVLSRELYEIGWEAQNHQQLIGRIRRKLIEIGVLVVQCMMESAPNLSLIQLNTVTGGGIRGKCRWDALKASIQHFDQSLNFFSHRIEIILSYSRHKEILSPLNWIFEISVAWSICSMAKLP